MRITKIWNDNPSDRQLQEIARDLDLGNVIIIPTDTLYAIVCDATKQKAIGRICRLKGINTEKTNLSIICSDISMASEYARFDNNTFMLIKRLTPGPFTFICRTAQGLPKAFKGRKSIGIRIPDCQTALRICQTLGRPILTTSIEYADEDHAINPELIAEAYHEIVDMMVEGKDGTTGVSTIIDCTSGAPEIIRQGAGEV